MLRYCAQVQAAKAAKKSTSSSTGSAVLLAASTAFVKPTYAATPNNEDYSLQVVLSKESDVTSLNVKEKSPKPLQEGFERTVIVTYNKELGGQIQSFTANKDNQLEPCQNMTYVGAPGNIEGFVGVTGDASADVLLRAPRDVLEQGRPVRLEAVRVAGDQKLLNQATDTYYADNNSGNVRLVIGGSGNEKVVAKGCPPPEATTAAAVIHKNKEEVQYKDLGIDQLPS